MENLRLDLVKRDASIAEIIDLIYEAAFEPDRWRDVLGHLTQISRSTATGPGILDKSGAFGIMDNPSMCKANGEFWAKPERARRTFITYAREHHRWRFMPLEAFLGNDYPDTNDCLARLGSRNIDHQLGTVVLLPNGQVVAFVCERLP